MKFAVGADSVTHPITVVNNSHVPNILGVDFFDRHAAQICFATKTLSLMNDGKRVEIPFTVDGKGWASGAVNAVEQECNASAISQDTRAIPAGCVLDIKAAVRNQTAPLHCSRTFLVEAAVGCEV